MQRGKQESMFTYQWDKQQFNILVGETIVDCIKREDAMSFVKKGIAFTKHLTFKLVDDRNVALSLVDKDLSIFFIDREEIFILSIEDFLSEGEHR
jgi:hypothetical protein